MTQRQLQLDTQTSSSITNESSTSIPESQNLLLPRDTISVSTQPVHSRVTLYHFSAGHSQVSLDNIYLHIHSQSLYTIQK